MQLTLSETIFFRLYLQRNISRDSKSHKRYTIAYNNAARLAPDAVSVERVSNFPSREKAGDDYVGLTMFTLFFLMDIQSTCNGQF